VEISYGYLQGVRRMVFSTVYGVPMASRKIRSLIL